MKSLWASVIQSWADLVWSKWIEIKVKKKIVCPKVLSSGRRTNQKHESKSSEHFK